MRTWINCFNLDRSMGAQYGKLPTISNMDYLANHCDLLWNKSPFDMQDVDIHLVAYNEVSTLLGNFHAEIYSDSVDFGQRNPVSS